MAMGADFFRDAWNGVDTGHGLKVNVLYADGHVEAARNARIVASDATIHAEFANFDR
jgi:prepilin-type processing-associated H-X9-DG protein